MNRREFLIGGATALLGASHLATADVVRSSAASRLRIAHLTDPQFGFGNASGGVEERYASDLTRFERAVEAVNALKPDAAVITGDMTHLDKDLARDWSRLLKRFAVPVIVAPGNHDMGNVVDAEKRERWISVFGYDYGAFDVKGWRIIAGNTQFWGQTKKMREKMEYEAWLKKELEKAKSYGGRVILAGHYPPFRTTPDERGAFDNYPKAGRAARLGAYLKAGANFYLAGHTHRFALHGWKGLTILNAETTSRQFDGRPVGFRLLDVAGENDYSYNFIRV